MPKTQCVILWSDHSWTDRDNEISRALNAGYQKSLGPYLISSALAAQGYSTEVVNMSYMTWDQLWARVEPLLDQDTLWVGVSTTFAVRGLFGLMTLKSDWRQIMQFMARVRTVSPKCQFAAGGYFSGVWTRLGWWVFKNHSDESIVAWTDHLAGRNPLWTHTNRIIEGNHNVLFKSRVHTWRGVTQGEALPLEISRGCRFKCAFCRFSLNGRAKNDYLRDPQCIRAELEANYAQWGTTRYTLADDTFNESTEKLESIWLAVKDLKFRVKFSAYIRVDLLESHPEQIQLLRNLGIENAMFGIESLNPRNGPIIGKARDPQRTIDFIAELRTQHWPGVGLHIGFILGLPWDRPESSGAELADWAVSDQCPLHSVSIESLNIIRPAWRKFWSENNTLSLFDADAEKYGYLWLDPREQEWTNSNTGMSLTQAYLDSYRAAEKIFHHADQHRVAGFAFNRFINLGIPESALTTQTIKQISQQWDLPELTRQRHWLCSSS
jgi:hypothetical protein